MADGTGASVDSVTKALSDYAASSTYEQLGPAAATATVNHLVDSIGVAIAGISTEPARVATRLARAAALKDGATVFGASFRTSPDLAAFANTIMVRTYDWNDGMQSPGGGHPSDMIPGILAIGEVEHASGIDVLGAIALAYEILGGLGAAANRKSFDQGLFMGTAVALACGRLLGLDKAGLAHAASLAITTAVPLQVNRWGALSMMKGAATAFAVRNGVFCARLAQQGFTSAPEPFEGHFGLWHILGEFQPLLPVLPDGPRVVEMSHQKPVPAETQVLGLLELVPRILEWTPVDQIEWIDIELSARAVHHVADPPKYDPHTRETADHSLPYMLAVNLIDGTLNLDSYRPERIRDPNLRPLMNKIRVTPNERFSQIRETGHYGVSLPAPARITVTTTDGRRFDEEVMYFRGHMRDPMTRADLDAKWDSICDGRLDDRQRDHLRSAWWAVESAPDIADLVVLLADVGASAGDAARRGGSRA
jgi:2-methylcitrate dehydratase